MRDKDPTDLRPVEIKFADSEERMVTETIDLDSLFSTHVTSSGSFDIRGGIWATTFGKVMQALPIPALLVDESFCVVVANQACRKISPNYEKIHGEPVAALFAPYSDPSKALSIVRNVFSSRKPRVLESWVEIEGSRIWGRMTFRPIRIAEDRLILALIEDLTLERKQRLHDKKHQEELEKMVKERTSDLEKVTQQLQSEISVRKRVEKRLRSSEASYRELVQGANSIILRRDLAGNIAFFNRFAQDFFGYSENEILGKNVVATILPEKDSYGRDLAEMTRDIGLNPERYANVEHENILRNGDRVWVSWTNKAITDGNGNRIGILSVGNDITQRKYAEAALRESEERYRTLFEKAGDAIFILKADNESGKIVAANHRAVVMNGYSLDELLTMSMADLDMMEHAGQIPERMPRMLATEWVEGNHLHRRKDGSVFPVESSAGCLELGKEKFILSIHRDVTERTYAEEQLRRSKETIEALLNATSDMAFLLESSGTFLAVNEQVAKQLRRRDVDLLGKSLFEVAPAGLAGVEESRFYEVIHSAKPTRFGAEQFGKFYDNNLFPVVDLEGIVIAVAVYIRDITAEKKTNELLMQSARIKAVGDMASGVAHNFNNVLQIVMNASYEVLADLELANFSEAETKMKRIIKSVSAGADTVRRLQDFAHARTDEAALSGKVFDLSSTVEQTLEILKPYWKTNPEKRGIKISLRCNLSKDCFVRGKENEMFEVVVNLIKNAVEALPRGGDIKISTYVDKDQVHLNVQDNGVGIAEANLERIFEPFWSTKGIDGIGMGLASSYGIVRRHKGEIFAESAPGHRTAFTVKLPLEKKSSGKGSRAPADRAQVAYRVLIIDDSEDSVWVLRNGLTREGQEVLASLSGHQGIEIFKNEQVDVVICDLGMPGLNGWEVGKALKDICLERGVPRPPFILLTGWGGLLDEKEKLLECGVDRILEKPFLVKNLLEIVQDLLEGRSQVAAESN